MRGIGELRPGDDLAAAIAEHAPPLRDGDVLVVTSKAVSKVEGRLVKLASVDPAEREAARQAAIDDETVREVARRGQLRIVADRRGLVLAAAGVDASNVARDEIAVLPVDPDRSAAALRDALAARLGVTVGVVISDSLGRPWRDGITDVAIGVAGLTAVRDARGERDRHGNVLAVTTVAVADEIAAAADLVKGKLSGTPVAVVRGLARDGVLADDGRGGAPLIRPAADDLFRLGTAEAIESGRREGLAQGRLEGMAIGRQEGVALGREEGVALGRRDAAGAGEAPPALHADAVSVITAFIPASPDEASVRQGFLGFLAARPDAMWRRCAAGHLTASAVVLDPSRRAVLLTLHPRAGQWLPLGGHCEPEDAAVRDAAAREAREESGIDGLSLDPAPLALSIHPITCSLGVPTRHFDTCYLALAPAGTPPVRSSESLDLRWFAWDALPDGAAVELPALLATARARLGA